MIVNSEIFLKHIFIHAERDFSLAVFVFRMEKENYSELYIVKMPNNFCGIGAMMLNHPKNVSYIVSNLILSLNNL